eukprot:TRINITY_DN472_c0_g2_i3.p1 TRINITY_DN472_c0_g2~~TRINITY_DN472_c0_g2_i3.p1  ORF type:complete len:113 (-),score=3.54 TRINITY_DN472_c0_g2_i3:1-339(-)
MPSDCQRLTNYEAGRRGWLTTQNWTLASRVLRPDRLRDQVRQEKPEGSRRVASMDRHPPFPVLCVDTCLLYTSDAADEEDSVDLGGRRIIKKKKRSTRLVESAQSRELRQWR